MSRCYGSSWSPDIIAWELCSAVHSVPTPQIHICLEYQSVTHRIRVLDPVTGSLKDTQEERHGHRDGREAAASPGTDSWSPPEAGRGGEDPPLEPLQGAQTWNTLTSDVWSPGLGEGGYLPGVLSSSFIELSRLP